LHALGENARMASVLRFGDDEVAFVVVDARYAPLLITTWVGAPSETQVRRYYDWLNERVEEARANDQQIVTVADARDADSPTATVRRLFAELADESFERHRGVLHGHVAVLSGTILRGALTAVSWMMRRGPAIQVEAQLSTGIQRALAQLGQLGVEPPELLPTQYRAPAPVELDDGIVAPLPRETSS